MFHKRNKRHFVEVVNMEIVNSLYQFFGFSGFAELSTLPEFISYMLEVFIGIWVVKFTISSLFRLVGYLFNSVKY